MQAAPRRRNSSQSSLQSRRLDAHKVARAAAPRAKATSVRPNSAPVSTSRLVPTTVFVRIRPFATAGGHVAGQEVAAKLDAWDEDSVTMTDAARRTTIFKFPTKVVIPRASQQEAWDVMLPALVEAWMTKHNNLMVLAYGQTGTGKTHTMFGTKESLQAETVHPDWGVLPRTVDACLHLIQAQRGRRSYILTASALEFYAGMCFDLLNDHVMVDVNPSGESMGQEMRVLEDMDGFYRFLEDVNTNRTTAATKMNSSSSRSHCAMLLTLFQFDHETNEFVATKFNLFDLAGSERVGKTGEQRFSGNEVFFLLRQTSQNGKSITDIPLGAQGMMINFELSALTSEILKATDQHNRGAKYAPPRSCSSAFQRYTGAIMTGRTRLSTVICLSPAAQNGSENLFSLKWGQGMAKLKAPNVTEKPVLMEQALQAAILEASKTGKELSSRVEGCKFWSSYKARADAAAKKVQFLELLRQKL